MTVSAAASWRARRSFSFRSRASSCASGDGAGRPRRRGARANAVYFASLMAWRKAVEGWGQRRCSGRLTPKLDIFCLTTRG